MNIASEAEIKNQEAPDIMYRYEELWFGLGVDEWGNPYPGHRIEIVLERYKVVKTTPKGVWVSRLHSYDILGDMKDSQRRFVRLNARKKLAYPTIEEAKTSFIARKSRQIKILKARLEEAITAKELIESGRKSSTINTRMLCC